MAVLASRGFALDSSKFFKSHKSYMNTEFRHHSFSHTDHPRDGMKSLPPSELLLQTDILSVGSDLTSLVSWTPTDNSSMSTWRLPVPCDSRLFFDIARVKLNIIISHWHFIRPLCPNTTRLKFFMTNFSTMILRYNYSRLTSGDM